jgi:hypothetical protein
VLKKKTELVNTFHILQENMTENYFLISLKENTSSPFFGYLDLLQTTASITVPRTSALPL